MVVVDCASSDGSAEAALAWRGGKATVIQPGENLGYGRASNLGIAEVDRAVTVVANPDLELLDGSLARLGSEARRSDLPARILAPLVLNPDDSPQDSAHGAPGSPALALAALVPPGAIPRALRTAVEPWRSPQPAPRSVGGGLLPGGAHGHVPATGPLRPTDLPLRRGHRARAAGRRRRGIRTWFWPRRPRAPPPRPLHRHRPLGARTWAAGAPAARGGAGAPGSARSAGSTTRSSCSRSPTGSP